MSDTAEKLRQELQATQRALAEAQARCERHDAEHQAVTKELEDNRSALLFMLEDLEAGRKKIEQAHIEWMAALDVVDDPIFLHDKQFRILRCNKAYRQCAGIPFHEIIGQPYYAIFPKAAAPLPCCLRAMEKAEEEEEEVAVGNAIYRSRAFSIHDEQGAYLYSVHTLECITERKRAAEALSESETRFRNLVETTSDWIWEVDKNVVYTYASPKIHGILGYEAAEIIGKTPFDLMPPEEAKRVADVFAPIAAAEKSFTNLENTNLHKDGHPVVLETNGVPVFDAEGKFRGYRGMDRDITERKRAEEELRLRAQLLDSVSDTIFVLDFNGNFVYLNEAAWKTRGYTRDEMMGIDLHVLDTPKYEKLIESRMRDLMEKGQSIFESEHRRKDGSVMPVEINACVIELGGRKLALSIIRDITERKRAEMQLKNSEERHRQIIQTSMDGFWITDTKGRILDVNDAYCQLTGYSREELLNMRIPDVEAKESPEETAQHIQEIMTKGCARFETRHRRKDGRLLDIEVSVVHRSDKEDGHFFIFLHDITKRKRMDEELQLTYFALNHAVDSVFFMEPSGKFLYVNETACRVLGYSKEELLSMSVADIDPSLPEGVPLEMSQATKKAGLGRVESEHQTKDGRLIPVEVIVAYLQYKGGDYHCSFVRDITERKQAEAAIAHANRALAALSAVNRSLVRADSEDELLQSICHAIVRQHGYQLAWVGYVQHDENKSIKIMAYASDGGDYPDTMQPTWAEEEHGMGPSGRAVRSGATQLCQDIANDPHSSPSRDDALKRGYAASITLPLTNGDGSIFGILNVYANEVNAFSPGEVDLLEEMAGDLAFGVRSLHTRHERNLALGKVQEQLVQLQDSLEDTMRAIAGIVEMRDPYTAGHQARVADLAATIARQMGLPDEQAHAIHLAGTVHDLGKIQIPAEILSKPGKITDLEFSLIKIHPQAGYDILKGIDFPWPIAQMVLQHHERLDGSGYPQGLKGDQIILEARIISVADVVEAMSSHRPYRPGLGVEVALAEIIKQRGIYFDPQVVDACLVVFHEQHYSFKS